MSVLFPSCFCPHARGSIFNQVVFKDPRLQNNSYWAKVDSLPHAPCTNLQSQADTSCKLCGS